MNTQEKTPMISRDETATILGVTNRTIRRYVDREKLRQVRDPINGRVWYYREEVEALRKAM